LGCSPRNGLEIPSDDDDSAAPAPCGSTDNAWPSVLPEYADYEGDGARTGDHLLNFTLTDQHDQSMCLSQLLGHVLIIDASTRWCGPCNEAAAQSAALWEDMKEIGPSFITTLMVQDGSGLPATLADVQWWADTYDIEYPVVVDNAGQTATAWGVTNYPVFLFVAPTGEVVERWEQKPAESDVLNFVAFAVEEWADDLRQSTE
jgi:peroxiredoxin